MTASDHLNSQQFTTLYHGTSAENAASIQREGFRAPDEAGHIFPAKWYTLTDDREVADAYSNAGATVELHVPNDRMHEHLWPGAEHIRGTSYAVKRSLPSSYVHAIHPVTDHVPYPA